MKKFNLSKQLILLILLSFLILTCSLRYILPKVLLPIYEENIYTMLKQPLDLLNNETKIKNSEIGYIYISNNKINTINLETSLDTIEILKKTINKNGKFSHQGKNYYYIKEENKIITKIALTNDDYVKKIEKKIINTILPIIIFTLLIVIGIILLWSQLLILKIEYLKEKVDNLDNDNYNKKQNFMFNDELSSLSTSIDDMKSTLKKQDEFKNQMYQNISHDFKTPLTVIKSYIEGIEDGIQNKEDGYRVIKEQINKLELKVHSLLYLNKLNYIKEQRNYKKEKTNVKKVVISSIEKFKTMRPDVKWKLVTDTKTNFMGSFDMWEAIIDNLLNNFVRYADKEIKITIKNNKIILYNDGPNINPDILNDIFSPYKKGIKGQFGLGLSIVKKTIHLFGYEISVTNEKKGISFIIK